MFFNPLIRAGMRVARGYQFDQQSSRRIGRNLRKSETFLFKPFWQSQKQFYTNQGSLAVLPPADGIPPKVDDVMGSAECEIMIIDDLVTGEHKEVTTGETTLVFNNTEATITRGADTASIMAVRNREGKFIADIPAATNTTGLIRVTFDEDFGTATGSVNCTVAKSEFDQYENGAGITADNSIGLESDKGNRGFVYVYADGTLEIVNAECPADS